MISIALCKFIRFKSFWSSFLLKKTAFYLQVNTGTLRVCNDLFDDKIWFEIWSTGKSWRNRWLKNVRFVLYCNTLGWCKMHQSAKQNNHTTENLKDKKAVLYVLQCIGHHLHTSIPEWSAIIRRVTSRGFGRNGAILQVQNKLWVKLGSISIYNADW